MPDTPERPLFLQAAEKQATAGGITPERLLADYLRRLSESNYPTPECLAPEDIQRFNENAELSAAQKQHLADCEECRSLLKASSPSSERIRPLMEEVRQTRRMTTAVSGTREDSNSATAVVNEEKTFAR